jgi:hypothetical protein
MLKNFLARLRWGSLSPEQKEELKTLPLSAVFSRPYLAPKLHKHY